MKNLIDYIQEGLKITKDTEIEDLYDTSGVYAYFKGGYMTDDESYIKKHKKDAIGVAVIADVEGKLHRIVIDKTDVSNKKVFYGGHGNSISGATTTKDEATALKDMNGQENTIAISKACHGHRDLFRTGSAAEDCQKKFDGKGYLPSMGEWKILYSSRDNVNRMMIIIGGTPIKEYYYWSSTLYNTSVRSWLFSWDTADTLHGYRSTLMNARAVMGI